MEVSYAASFIRTLEELPELLQEEIIEKITLFQDIKNHKQLKVHKLRGRLRDRFSFSVNYSTRIIFRYLETSPKEAVLLMVGDHDIYN